MYHSPMYLAPFLNLYVPWYTDNTRIIKCFYCLREQKLHNNKVFCEQNDLARSLAVFICSLVSVSIRQDSFALSMSLSSFISVSLILLQHKGITVISAVNTLRTEQKLWQWLTPREPCSSSNSSEPTSDMINWSLMNR